MAFPCRETLINSSYNVKSMTEDKKATIVTLAQDLETTVAEINSRDSKDSILSRLNRAEGKLLDLSKSLGVKIKKTK